LCHRAVLELSNVWLIEDAQEIAYFSARGLFAAELAHDIRNPLESIHLLANRLKASCIDTNVARAAEQLRGLADEAREIADGFIGDTESRGKQRLDQVLVEAALPIATVHGEDRLWLRLGPDLPSIANALGLKRAVRNLLENAIAASGATDRIELYCTRSGVSTVIEVVDRGTGMTESERRGAFKALYTTREEGKGLGLASCRSALARLGALVSVESKPGIGTKIRVELPAELYTD
jgi:signal transduction histidine kinase